MIEIQFMRAQKEDRGAHPIFILALGCKLFGLWVPGAFSLHVVQIVRELKIGPRQQVARSKCEGQPLKRTWHLFELVLLLVWGQLLY